MRYPTTFFLLMFGLLPAFPVVADQRLSDLLLQIQRLQEEVQQLRGQVEVQGYRITTLGKQQREQYMDLDSRLGGRSAAASTPPGAPVAAGTSAKQTLVASEGSSAESKLYQAAFDLLKQRRYDDAIRAFQDQLARYPNGEYADNAIYWLGEASYVKRDYSGALTQFQRLLASYPLSPKVPGSMLKIGYIHYDQGDVQRARTTFQDVVTKFPNSDEAHLAKSRLESMTHGGR
jgi:tol-pal system protein YbgF